MKYTLVLLLLLASCTQVAVQTTDTAPTGIAHTVEMSASGFSPNIVTIKAGDAVEFVNKGTIPIWPASDVHPTHTVYPGSGIGKCGSSEESAIFDACGGVPPGESYTFTFLQRGNWSLHDHLHPLLTGTIVVQ